MQSVQFGRRFVFKVGPGFEEAFRHKVSSTGRKYYWINSDVGNKKDSYLAYKAAGEDLIILTDTREDDPPVQDLGRIRQALDILRMNGVLSVQQRDTLMSQSITDCFARAEALEKQNKQNPF